MDVPAPVRALALHPFRELPPPPGVERITRDGFLLSINPYPTAQIVEPLDIALDKLPTIVETARTLARERGKSLLAWWVAPEHDEQGARLEGVGLVNNFPQRWEEYCQPGNPGRQYIASVAERIVGTAGTGFGEAGVNLFGGSVAEDARGQGVYRALVVARWEAAVARGTPALTVQAGRMSKPIVERLGFREVGQVRVYVDDVAA